jgi:hypothetical protein
MCVPRNCAFGGVYKLHWVGDLRIEYVMCVFGKGKWVEKEKKKAT